MNAKKMFEELGFYYKEGYDCISYTKEVYYNSEVIGVVFIKFDLINKEYFFEVNNYSDYNINFRINYHLHKAINKQIEEVGWDDDN